MVIDLASLRGTSVLPDRLAIVQHDIVVAKFVERSPLTPTLSPFGERGPGPESTLGRRDAQDASRPRVRGGSSSVHWL